MRQHRCNSVAGSAGRRTPRSPRHGTARASDGGFRGRRKKELQAYQAAPTVNIPRRRGKGTMEYEYDSEREVTYHYRYHRADSPRAAAGETPSECPACGGTGKVLLLVSTRHCEACGGLGKIKRPDDGAAAASPAGSEVASDEPDDGVLAWTEEAVRGHWVTTTAYDEQGRERNQAGRFIPDPLAGGAGRDRPGGAQAGGIRC
jgi:hypothetical protein